MGRAVRWRNHTVWLRFVQRRRGPVPRCLCARFRNALFGRQHLRALSRVHRVVRGHGAVPNFQPRLHGPERYGAAVFLGISLLRRHHPLRDFCLAHRARACVRLFEADGHARSARGLFARWIELDQRLVRADRLRWRLRPRSARPLAVGRRGERALSFLVGLKRVESRNFRRHHRARDHQCAACLLRARRSVLRQRRNQRLHLRDRSILLRDGVGRCLYRHRHRLLRRAVPGPCGLRFAHRGQLHRHTRDRRLRRCRLLCQRLHARCVLLRKRVGRNLRSGGRRRVLCRRRHRPRWASGRG